MSDSNAQPDHFAGRLVRDGATLWSDAGHRSEMIATTTPQICGPGMASATCNAERIRQCWNACLGINPEAVPDLLAALHLIADAHANCGMTYCQDVASDAIARAKGGAA
jgi:hypothetical protein